MCVGQTQHIMCHTRGIMCHICQPWASPVYQHCWRDVVPCFSISAKSFRECPRAEWAGLLFVQVSSTRGGSGGFLKFLYISQCSDLFCAGFQYLCFFQLGWIGLLQFAFWGLFGFGICGFIYWILHCGGACIARYKSTSSTLTTNNNSM